MEPSLSGIAISLIFALGLIGFASARIRHDLVALLMLVIAVVLGLVSASKAFSGFADPVVITVAAIMLLSAAISRSGVLTRALKPFQRWMGAEVGIVIVFALLCAVASAFMNNVGALALLLPVALATCRSADVSPSRVLMPMAFASLLGGLVTLIGTPPNVILAELRTHYGHAAFGMFDFAKVGLPLALTGTALTILSARLLTRRAPSEGELLQFKIADYLFEIRIPDGPKKDGLTVDMLASIGSGDDRLAVHAIDRGGILLTAPSGTRELLNGDIIQIEGRAPVVETALARFGLELASDVEDDLLEKALMECVVADNSGLPRMENATQILAKHGAALVAVSRRGRGLFSGLSDIDIRAGDVLLLQLPLDRRIDITTEFGLLPLAERQLSLGTSKSDWLPVFALFGAIVAASTGLTTLSVGLIFSVVVLGVAGRLPGQAYRDIDWSIVVLLAALIPVAQAFADSGAGEWVASLIGGLGQGKPGWVMIAAALGLTMIVTPFLNNAAAVMVMGPIAANAGIDAGVSVDAMLMAVAVGASCDFLTPIGHQSNTLVWGPGGYRFSDYARIGAPLTALVLLMGTVLISHYWA